MQPGSYLYSGEGGKKGKGNGENERSKKRVKDLLEGERCGGEELHDSKKGKGEKKADKRS